jgi:hypothetical protein
MNLEIEECSTMYNLYGKEKKDTAGAGGKGGGGGSTQKVNLFETMSNRGSFAIANHMLYCPLGIIDLTTGCKAD